MIRSFTKPAVVRRMVVVCALGAVAAACTTARDSAVSGPREEKEAYSLASAGGTGVRAKGEEGSMGNPLSPAPMAPPSTAAASPALRPRPRGAVAGGFVGGIVGGSGAGLQALSGSGATPRSHATAAFEPPPSPAPQQLHVLDANARYATTYRPGGAAIAAFDAAVARGQIPATYQDLVGDFGARYAPALSPPAQGALAVAVNTERTAVGPAGSPVNLRVALTSSDAMPSRAPLSVHIVLDTSGSMSGKAIDDARNAAEAVVRKLAPNDDFSMVTFSESAHLLVPDGPIGWRQEQALASIRAVRADGGTNISEGLDLAYAQARSRGIPADAVRIVMLLSDGHANAGDTDPQRLADRAVRAFQEGVQTSTFGVGGDFDAALMSRIADRGAGAYYYLADSSQIAPALDREIDARLRPVATALELRVRLRPDVTATHVFGSRELSEAEASDVRVQEVAADRLEARRGIARDRQTDAGGGMRFFFPAFARSDRHATMITLAVPPGTGERTVASVELRYKDRVLGRNVTREIPVKVRYAATDAESAATEDASVEQMAQAFAAGEAVLSAADRVESGDRAGARQMLEERAEILRRAADTLAQPMLAEDGGRLARLAAAVGGAEQVGDPLSLVVMLRGSAYGYL